LGNCSVCHAQTWLEIPSGRKLEMDKKTPHVCKSVNAQTLKTVQELPQTAREKRIDELAVTRTATFERIAVALEKNNNQNVADAIYAVAATLSEVAQVIKELASKKEISK
jgi:hypothetical protein